MARSKLALLLLSTSELSVHRPEAGRQTETEKEIKPHMQKHVVTRSVTVTDDQPWIRHTNIVKQVGSTHTC